MATAAITTASRFPYLKPLLWLIFGLLLLSVFILVDLPIFDPANPSHDRMKTARPILIPHIVAAITTILLGPLQFSSRFRRRYLNLHRLFGKVYVIAVLLAAPPAAMLAFHAPGLLPFAGAVQSSLWIIATLAAFLTARNGNITEHRRWMVRSYGVGCAAFVPTRLPIDFLQRFTPDQTAAEILLLIILAFFLPEIVWSRNAVLKRS